jgi:hypothetical protein
MELRRQFIQDVRAQPRQLSELCAAYQISRKTGCERTPHKRAAIAALNVSRIGLK